MRRWLAVAGAVLFVGCTSGRANEIGRVRSGDTEFVVELTNGFARTSLKKGGESSLVVGLTSTADVDFMRKMIDTGMASTETPAEGAEVMVSKMNTGRPEARIVVATTGGKKAFRLVYSNRADAAPAPLFSFELTPQTLAGVEALLDKTRERFAAPAR